MVSTFAIRLACIPAALFCAAPAAWAEDAAAMPVMAAQWQANIDFDLQRDCPKAPAEKPRGENRDDAAGAQPATWASEVNGVSAKEELGPSWTLESGKGGPVLQIAALGAGKKDRPGLAHLAIDWNF